MNKLKTPGVYVREQNAFPNSVIEVASAVAACVGYTAIADDNGRSLFNRPMRITSMLEFERCYGGMPAPRFEIVPLDQQAADDSDFTIADGAAKKIGYRLDQTAGHYLLHASMALFFKNGGAVCYVVSVGTYEHDIDANVLVKGIDVLSNEREPTILVVPDAVCLPIDGCVAVQQAMRVHCSQQVRNRFAILDVHGGYRSRAHPAGDCVTDFRARLDTTGLASAAAYYPWVNTTVVAEREVSFANVGNIALLQSLMANELKTELPLTDLSSPERQVKAEQIAAALADLTKDWRGEDSTPEKNDALHRRLTALSPLYAQVMLSIRAKRNLLPPSAAIAGVYAASDSLRGVWKAPANVGLNGVVSPAIDLTHEEQEDLNAPTDGKSVNAIRSVVGQGVLVWGARTLDGNSADWRYISVRRTVSVIEESLRQATLAYVFEPNTANTWLTLKSMIVNFLTGIWKQGGLVGDKPEDAFSVCVGLGQTMTADDILQGILRLTVLLALHRPAEFIEITFQQQMQRS